MPLQAAEAAERARLAAEEHAARARGADEARLSDLPKILSRSLNRPLAPRRCVQENAVISVDAKIAAMDQAIEEDRALEAEARAQIRTHARSYANA